jgi:hypothetical protein
MIKLERRQKICGVRMKKNYWRMKPNGMEKPDSMEMGND